MADEQDKSQQTEEPTAKRLEQARESGDIVKSSEVTSYVLLAGGTLAIAMFGHSTAVAIAKLLTMFIERPEEMSVDGARLAYARPVAACGADPGALHGRDDPGQPRRPCDAKPAIAQSRQAHAGFLQA